MAQQPVVDPIQVELLRIEESAEYSAQSQFSQAKIWRAVNLCLGAPSSVLAAISGGTVLAGSAGRWTGILGLVAAGLGAIMTTLNAARRAEVAHTSANNFLALQNDARIARTVDLPGASPEQARLFLESLNTRRSELIQGAEIPFRIAYWSARRNISRGGTTYRVDKNA